jgi:uncharacterized membrane protein
MDVIERRQSMSNDFDPFDPTGESERTIGRGVFEEEMGPGSSFAHLYRGEVYRMRFWRERLDRTTHWAIIVIAAILTWAFSSRSRPHYIILMAVAILSVFLLIEARRFRGYDVWRSRVRALQKNVFAHGLDPSRDLPNPQWREVLSEDYRTPTVRISIEESLAHRLRRVYIPLYGLLGVAWIIHITGFVMESWPQSATIAGIPGVVVTALVAVFYLVIGVVAYRPRTWHVAGEIRGAENGLWNSRR